MSSCPRRSVADAVTAPAAPWPRRVRRWVLAVVAAVGAAGAVAQAPAPDVDVPFVVTPDNVTLAMLELAAVTPGDHVIDLGSGDGRIVILAARRFGATGLGVEIVDDLVRRSRANAESAGVADRVTFRNEDLFTTDLTRATVITMYLLPEVNLQLRPRLLALRPGTRIVSHDYDLGDWPPERTIVVDAPGKPVGSDQRSHVHLWVVPAPVAGLWCDTTAGHAMRIEQRYQQLTADIDGVAWRGRVAGTRLTLHDPAGRTRALRAEAGALVADEVAPAAAPRPGRYTPAGAGGCPRPASR